MGVNAATNRVYVANTLSNSVFVLDGVSNSVIATVPVGSQPIGVGVNAITNRIYVSNSGGNTVSCWMDVELGDRHRTSWK